MRCISPLNRSQQANDSGPDHYAETHRYSGKELGPARGIVGLGTLVGLPGPRGNAIGPQCY